MGMGQTNYKQRKIDTMRNIKYLILCECIGKCIIIFPKNSISFPVKFPAIHHPIVKTVDRKSLKSVE